MSSVTLLRRLGNHSREDRLYRAFGELGRAIRTITLLRYLSEPVLREQAVRRFGILSLSPQADLPSPGTGA